MKQIKRLTLAVAALLASVPLASAQDAVRYVHLDALGSVRAVSNEANVVIERHDYLPFGEECTTGPCASNPGVGAGQPRKFTGKERDQETGLDYFGARYYGARIGRFTTLDPVYTWQENLLDPQRWNRYAYVRNNPLRYVDPDGRQLYGPGSPTDRIAKQRLNDYLEGRITEEQYTKLELAEGAGTLAILSLVVPDPSDAVVAAVAGRAIARFGRLFGKADDAIDASADVAKLSNSAQRGIRSLEKRIAEHEKKLAEFKANPTIRPGMENQPAEVIAKQQQARIEHLETEVRAFRESIETLRQGGR